jgi:hypothetical protein
MIADAGKKEERSIDVSKGAESDGIQDLWWDEGIGRILFSLCF